MDVPSHNTSQFSLTAILSLFTASAVLVWLYFTIYPFGPLFAWFGAATVVAVVARRYRNRLLGVACAGMFGVGLLAIPYFMIDGHSVSPYRLERIRIGSTAADVEFALGTPSSVTTAPSGDDWLYSGPTWCQVTVSFDPNQMVDSIVHDH